MYEQRVINIIWQIQMASICYLICLNEGSR